MALLDNTLVTDPPEAFAAACGMPGPLDVRAVHRTTGAERTCRTGKPFLFLGRAQSMGLRLDDPSVSQCHAYLQVVGGVLYCADLGSRAGVEWENGARGRGRVDPGQTLRIGVFDVSVDLPGADPASYSPPQPARLEVYPSPDGPEALYTLDRPLTLVGRHPNCDLRFLGDAIPYFQCALITTPGGVWCVDILTPNGTLVNGRKIRLTPVGEGDLIELGKASLVVRTGPPDGRPLILNGAAGTRAVEVAATIPQAVAEAVAGALSPVREALGQIQRNLADVTSSLTTARQEYASAIADQSRQIGELIRQLEGLRATPERGSPTPSASPAAPAAAALPPLGEVEPQPAGPRVDAPVRMPGPATETTRAAPTEPIRSEEPPPGPPQRTERANETPTTAQSERPAAAGPDRADSLAAMNDLAQRHWNAGRRDEALAVLGEAFRIRRERLGPEHPETLQSMSGLGAALVRAGRAAEAVPLFEEMLGRQAAVSGPDHPASVAGLGNLAQAYLLARQGDKALPLLGAFVPAIRQQLGADSPRFAGALATVSFDLLTARQFAAAETHLGECLAILERRQPDDWFTFHVQSMLGGALLGQRRYADAEPLLLAGYEGLKQREAAIPPAGKARLPEAAGRLADLYTESGQPEEAAKWVVARWSARSP